MLEFSTTTHVKRHCLYHSIEEVLTWPQNIYMCLEEGGLVVKGGGGGGGGLWHSTTSPFQVPEQC